MKRIASRSRRALFVVFASLLGFASPAQADLIDVEDGTVLSTDLGVYFLKDMNTAMSTGYDADGVMDWFAAMEWIDQLNASAYLGHSDWELASGSGVGGGQFPLREHANYLERLFYDELGNTRPGSSANNVAPEDFQYGPFVNLGSSVAAGYWVFPELIDPSCVADGTGCFAASYRIFEDHYDGDSWGNYATAVRRASVPEPATLLLFGPAAAAWLLVRRRRTKRIGRRGHQKVGCSGTEKRPASI